jgi:hypothetical protein
MSYIPQRCLSTYSVYRHSDICVKIYFILDIHQGHTVSILYSAKATVLLLIFIEVATIHSAYSAKAAK